MPNPRPLPSPLNDIPFAVAEARQLGIGSGRLDGDDLTRPFYGVRSLGAHPLFRSYAPRLRPGDRFSHTTAAKLWGAPLPRAHSGRLHVTAAAGLTRPRARGVIGHVGRTGIAIWRSGQLVSDPVTTFLEIAGLLSLDDLVAVGDHVVLGPRVLDPKDVRPYTSIEELQDVVTGYAGRGARRARQALALLRPGAESRMESLLRLLLLRAGLPEPVCGYELRDGRGRIGWFDLAWPDWRVIAEYDGDQHRTSTTQYELDIRRFDRADDAQWRVIRVRSHGILRDPDATVARVRSALQRAGWVPTRHRSTSDAG
jgi:hypothetical protein